MDIDIIQKKIERVQRKVEGSCGSFFGSIGDAIFDTFFQTYILTKKNIILYVSLFILKIVEKKMVNTLTNLCSSFYYFIINYSWSYY